VAADLPAAEVWDPVTFAGGKSSDRRPEVGGHRGC